MAAMLPILVTQAMRNPFWEIECEVTGKSSSEGPYKPAPAAAMASDSYVRVRGLAPAPSNGI